MKLGKSLVELAQELERRAGAKSDFIVDTKSGLLMQPDMALAVSGVGALSTDGLAHRQISEWAGIPAKYYDRMKAEAPALLVNNVNHWFAEQPARRMVRTLDNRARAFLSDRYRRIDNEEIAEAVLPVLLGAGSDIRIESCEVTDSRLYLKAVFPKIEGEVKVGDPVQSGIVISNSEAGLGSLSVQPLVFRLVCKNGMIANDSGMSRYHVGRKVGDGRDVEALLRDETKMADDRALMMALQDVVRASLDNVQFTRLLDKMRVAAGGDTVQRPVEAVETLAKSFVFAQSERQSILENLIRDGDYSRWGMLNAVTKTANLVSDYDRATELEAVGGRILDLAANDWSVIAAA
jgi:hypothetical protein